jgi:hypothetical protein
MPRTSANLLSTPTKRVAALFWLVVVAVITFYVAAIAGPRWREESRRQTTTEIQEENRAFCEDLGFGAGTPQHARCEDGAGLIREKEIERSQLRTLGIR